MRLADATSSSPVRQASCATPAASTFQTALDVAKSAAALVAPVGSQHADPPLYNPGWLPPTDWFAHNPPGSSHTGKDPFNVIISGNSNVTLPEILNALEALHHPAGAPEIEEPDYSAGLNRWGPNKWKAVPAQWAPVPTSSSLLNPGTGPENADVQPWGGKEVPQQVSMRVGGTETEFGSDINHFRVYRQNDTGAYFIAASTESFNPHWGLTSSFPFIASPYHDVVSFNQGRNDLVGDIEAAARAQGWNVQVTQIHAEGSGKGTNGKPYDGTTDVLTITV